MILIRNYKLEIRNYLIPLVVVAISLLSFGSASADLTNPTSAEQDCIDRGYAQNPNQQDIEIRCVSSGDPNSLFTQPETSSSSSFNITSNAPTLSPGISLSAPTGPVTDPKKAALVTELAKKIARENLSPTTPSGKNNFVFVIPLLDGFIKDVLKGTNYTAVDLAIGLLTAPKTPDVSTALTKIQALVDGEVNKQTNTGTNRKFYPDAYNFLDKFPSGGGPPARGDDGGGGGPGPGSGGGGTNGGGGGGGGGASTPGAVRCDIASLSNANLTGIDWRVEVGQRGKRGPQSPLGYIYGKAQGQFTLPFGVEMATGDIGLPVIESGPLLDLVGLREIPLLQRICTAVSGLAADIRVIRDNTTGIWHDTKILVNDNETVIKPKLIQIEQWTHDLREKEYVLDPAVRKLASEAIEVKRGIFERELREGRKQPVAEYKNGKPEPLVGQYIPDINVYEAEARQNAGRLFYGELKNYMRSVGMKTTLAGKEAPLLAKVSAMAEDENSKDNPLSKFRGLSALTNADDQSTYISNLYAADLQKASENAIAEYIAGGTVISSKGCTSYSASVRNPNEGNAILYFKDGVQTIICKRNQVKIVTPAPEIRAKIEKFATTEVTQLEQADEYKEFPVGSDDSDTNANPPPETPATPLPPIIPPEPDINIGPLPPTIPPPSEPPTTTQSYNACVKNATDKVSACGTIPVPSGVTSGIENICRINSEAYKPISCPAGGTAVKQTTSGSLAHTTLQSTNLASVGSLIKSTPKLVSTTQSAISLEAKTVNSTDNKESLITLSINNSKDATSCMATSDWLTFDSSDKYSILKESYLFKIGEIIPAPSRDAQQIFTINHPQLFTLKIDISEPEILTINNQTPAVQTNIKNEITRNGSGIIQTSSYALDLTGIEVEDTIILTINDTSLSLPIINRNAIDIIRRLITEATAGRADIKKAFSSYNFSQNGNILVVSNKTPVNISLPPTANYSLECNVDNKAVSNSVNIAF